MAETKTEHLQYNTMTLNGQGHVTTNPNTAVIRLGVQTIGENIEAIQSENAELSENVIQALTELGITNIRTFQYVIDKNYEFEDGIRVDKGYIVRNILEIQINDLDNAGFVIDTAVNNGANVVDFISFEVDDPSMFYQQALNLAIMDAMRKAKSIARQLDTPFDPIPIRIVENSSSPMPRSQQYFLREIASTPIEPGIKQIDAFVSVEFIF
ncbi:hypothetical protein EDD66_107154 [Mobilisporobacter senegalensis]|uniref:DUF541 domain-containing protein n=1 Tax=Mobilisporobacter senegalensis TaxID=1329262 RepID=A0A3N1XKJ7_9FIRM|nr:SIMPL domain-containing protein [Mobilisporobacter senegalensis]ROR27240.1 hypothetical protein EDD66_107154 [Mobilisporobacter senegalensis]